MPGERVLVITTNLSPLESVLQGLGMIREAREEFLGTTIVVYGALDASPPTEFVPLHRTLEKLPNS
ncbi:MAG: hypothetical protein AAB367_04430 [Patescibacteria group bacterium]